MKKNWVGVVADKPWQAIQAAEKLKVTWTPGTGLPSQRDFYNYMRNHPGKRDTYAVNSKDVDTKLTGATTRIKATYLHPYQMHGSIGSSCAVADVKGNNATIWSATQAVYPLRSTSAMVLGLEPQNIRVIYARGSGCYGLNGADGVSMTRRCSQAVGKPVRVQLSRKDEMAWGENMGCRSWSISRPVSMPAATSSRGTTRRGRRPATGPATTRRATWPRAFLPALLQRPSRHVPMLLTRPIGTTATMPCRRT